MEEYETFIEKSLKGELLQVLASRWAALIPALARATQKVQRDDLDDGLDVVDEKFLLAHTILSDEYAIHAAGIRIALTKENDFSSHFKLLLQAILSSLSVKECVLADWRTHVLSISPDTLRVYCHSILATSGELFSQAERCLLLLQPSV